MEEQNNTQIVKLEAENIKRLKAVSITPEGNLIGIGGNNGEGKTSVLDSIEYALNGGKCLPTRPLRDGEKEGRVVLETENLIIERTFKPGSSSLVVRKRESGLQLGSPQAILDNLTADLTFDPLEFSKMKSAEQKATLQTLIGLDFTEVDAVKKAKFDERTSANREAKSLQAKKEGMTIMPDVPEELVDVSALSQQLFAMTQAKSEYDRKIKDVEMVAEKYGNIQSRITDLKAELAASEDEATQIFSDGERMRAEIDAFEEPDVTNIQSQIENANDTNNAVRNNLEASSITVELDKMKAISEDLSEEIIAIDEEKERQIHEAMMPVSGLGFGDEGVTFNNIPFEQCSGAETLRVSVAMGMALNPELKILLIRDGSLLDNKSLAMIGEMAKEKEYQVWMERVLDGAECQVVMEDGSVREDRTI